MRNAVQDVMFQRIFVAIRVGRLELWRILEARESARQHDESRQQDPGADSRQNVVKSWYLVQLEEHIHITCLDGNGPLKLGLSRHGVGGRLLIHDAYYSSRCVTFAMGFGRAFALAIGWRCIVRVFLPRKLDSIRICDLKRRTSAIEAFGSDRYC